MQKLRGGTREMPGMLRACVNGAIRHKVSRNVSSICYTRFAWTYSSVQRDNCPGGQGITGVKTYMFPVVLDPADDAWHVNVPDLKRRGARRRMRRSATSRK